MTIPPIGKTMMAAYNMPRQATPEKQESRANKELADSFKVYLQSAQDAIIKNDKDTQEVLEKNAKQWRDSTSREVAGYDPFGRPVFRLSPSQTILPEASGVKLKRATYL